MAVVLTLGVISELVGCRLDSLGKPCAADEQCGPGFDCFRNICFEVCTKDEECRAGQVCHRYHCLEPGKERADASAAPTRAVPPTPDATVAELRAMRHELEVLRRDVARLVTAAGLESTRDSPKPEAGSATHSTPAVIALPPAAPAQR